MNWQLQSHAVNVSTPYTPGVRWTPAAWVRDAETQTASLHDLVKEVVNTMVTEHLRSKGLPLIACPHTRGLQLENIINGIVDSHRVTCTESNESQHHDWTKGITLQDLNAYDVEVQQASRLVEQMNGCHSTVSTEMGGRKLTEHAGIGKVEQLMGIVDQLGCGESIATVTTEMRAGKYTQNANIGKDSGLTLTLPNEVGQMADEILKQQKTTSGAVHRCEKCNKSFTCRKDLGRHFASHSLERPFKCEKCDYRAKTKHDWHKHTQTTHNKRYPHHCGTCGKGCSTLKGKVEHEYCHLANEDKPFKCKYCNKGFPLERRMDIHLRKHEKDKQIKCDLCECTFVTSNGYNNHLKFVHKALFSAKSNRCLVCDVEMIERHLLMTHMKENHTDIGYKCDQCAMKFSCNLKLEAHLNRQHRQIPLLGQSCEEKGQSPEAKTAPKTKLGRPPNSTKLQINYENNSNSEKGGQLNINPNMSCHSNDGVNAGKTGELLMSGRNPLGNQSVQGLTVEGHTCKEQDGKSLSKDDKGVFVINTETPNNMVDMLLQGKMKVSLKIPVSGSVTSAISSNNL
ncbi:uncharacterized protein [Amphiura filiformis]|uniref:uncharacterized protein n=1 Tax=Amphiura filiformis TaxID=82378 RepID=UPI003B21816A